MRARNWRGSSFHLLTTVARALGYTGSPEALDSAVSPRGFRLLAKVPRLPGAIIDRLVEHFGGLGACEDDRAHRRRRD